MLLHAEESLEIFDSIKPGQSLVCQVKLLDLQDKKKATIFVLETSIRDKESDNPVAKITTSYFVRGIGGFGNRGTIKQVYP